MFKTTTKVLHIGSGLALFCRLEYALAFSQIEQIPVICALNMTRAGFSSKTWDQKPVIVCLLSCIRSPWFVL